MSARSELCEILARFAAKTGAVHAVLVSVSGRVVANSGTNPSWDDAALSASVAALFGAARQVAKLMGEPRFGMMLQQGEKRHMQLSLINDRVMLLVLFEDMARTGAIRFEAKRIAEELGPHVAGLPAEPEPPEAVSLPEIKEYSLRLIDQMFQP